MRYSPGFLGLHRRAYANLAEQKVIQKLTGLLMRAVYYDDEASVVWEKMKQELRAGRADRTS